MIDEKRLPITEHFTEMRQRFIRSIFGLVVGVVIGMFVADKLVLLLERPAGDLAGNIIATEMLETFSTYFKVAMTAGFIIAMPWIIYQMFAFLTPALTAKEKRFLFLFFPFIVLMFLAGVAFAYFVALPPAIHFLFTFTIGDVTVMPRISNYVDIVLRMLVIIGLVFELPIILMALSAVGLVTSKWLASKRKIWFVLAFIISAFITPTFDPINQSIVAAPLIILYELSIWLTKIVKKRKPRVPAIA
ncbi:twin-arginine translocase subunit TatC [Dehalogenimonas etheniformans]|uniref:Sec-independent protein translocase protein TatC n=1 Tax=Dehalogenimonas etheniformans TaxID=1536648 RepID=A0A2P5P6J7_9CHLR|nr:twin-arginine translocase subunit TatC [Dehalogenimonas etheniformans]PPD57915.1 twin-arginine translocase subunit TatC [Dehalogenimonas etheniformans]QNT75433.1 twin-arginine translocase subunit TatC [Dehalogenimonas etheniformans]